MFAKKETEESLVIGKKIRADIYTLIEKYGVRLTNEETEVTKTIEKITEFEESTPYFFLFNFLCYHTIK